MSARDEAVQMLAQELADAVHATAPLIGWASRLIDQMVDAGWAPPAPTHAAREDRAAMSIDPEPPGATLRPFTPVEVEALDLSDYAEDYIAQDHAENDAPRLWQPGDPINYADPNCTCRLGGMGRRADCPVQGDTRDTPPAPTHADEEGEG